MDMKIIPNVGFGEIRFGMNYQEIELKLSCDKERIIKGYEIQLMLNPLVICLLGGKK